MKKPTTVAYGMRKYKDWYIDEAICFVYNAKTEKNAVTNAKLLFKNYKKNLSFWELIKLLFKK